MPSRIGSALIGWRGYALVFVIGALLAGAGAWNWQANGYERQLSERGRELAGLRERRAEDVATAVKAARLEEQRRTAAQTEIANDAIQKARAAQADALAADAARRELLARVTALANASRRPGDSDAVGGGAAARDPLVLLADVFGRVDQRAGELAQYADAARIAGQACERSYDALTVVEAQ